MKFRKGDRIASVGGTMNCYSSGKIGTIKRRATGFPNREMYVVVWDDGQGWVDPLGGIGWNIEAFELQLISEIEPFEVDE